MDIKLRTCFIAVDDHDKALAFYRDVLGHGGPQRRRVRGHALGDRRLSGAARRGDRARTAARRPQRLGRGPQEAMVGAAGQGLPARRDPRHRRPATPPSRRSRAAGAEVLQEPVDQLYGVRDCAFRDPAGNMVRFKPAAQGLRIRCFGTGDGGRCKVSASDRGTSVGAARDRHGRVRARPGRSPTVTARPQGRVVVRLRLPREPEVALNPGRPRRAVPTGLPSGATTGPRTPRSCDAPCRSTPV